MKTRREVSFAERVVKDSEARQISPAPRVVQNLIRELHFVGNAVQSFWIRRKQPELPTHPKNLAEIVSG
jgi:hypothetical protein